MDLDRIGYQNVLSAHDAIRVEAAPNAEMTLIADVNRELLKLERNRGLRC